MQLSLALTPLEVKSMKRERSFMIEEQSITLDDLSVYLWFVKSSFIPKEGNYYV
jgi:hypothetical protein